jgi:hypothetical protein
VSLHKTGERAPFSALRATDKNARSDPSSYFPDNLLELDFSHLGMERLGVLLTHPRQRRRELSLELEASAP